MLHRVLLVEDSAQLRPLIQRMLEEGGYEVATARDAESALAWMESSGCGLDLMLCDLMLPDANGLELARKAAQICPDIPALHMSGFNLEMPAGVEFIPKPFTAEQLLDRVAKLIECRSGPQ